MQTGRNRRLANAKTRRETGLEYVLSCLQLCTPFGRRQLKELRPYFPGEEEALEEEFERVATVVRFVTQNPALAGDIRELLLEVKNADFTIERSARSTLSVVEIYEIKSLLLLMRRLRQLTGDAAGAAAGIPEAYILRDTTDLLDRLDPRRDRINTFYIYDEFSETLAALRRKKRDLELAIRREQKAGREEIRRTYGIQLTPKFDIVLARSAPELETALSIPALEQVAEDYMSVTFRLRPTDAVYALVRETEELNGQIEEEEERVREALSRDIAAWADVLTENCTRIGALDLALAKAQYAVRHDCVRPEILEAHRIEIEDGRNLQVEDILRENGKSYCPVSLSLDDGVTCITGANMGGKTISLKLAGQVVLLTQYGFFVPCRKARIGLSGYVQILIGDSQSIERGLSSFGSEMEELKEILDNSTDRSVLLIDEIAGGTNPVEGLALTRSLVDYLKEKPYITLLTTHFETVTETEGVINLQVRGLADVDFSKLSREIRYASRKERIDIIGRHMDYRLYRVRNQRQVPRDALNIAEMLGIDREIIDGAQKYL